MKKLTTIIAVLFCLSVSAQFTPTGSKTRFVNGIGLSASRTSGSYNTADSLVLFSALDSSLYFKYKGTARALAYAVSGGYIAWSDTGRAATAIVTGGSLNKVRDSLQANINTKQAAFTQGISGYIPKWTSASGLDTSSIKQIGSSISMTGHLNVNGAPDTIYALNVNGTGRFNANVKIDSALYFKVHECCSPLINDTNYAGISYRYTGSLIAGYERIGRRALVSRFPLYVWERNDSKWVGSLSDTGMGIGIDASDTINYVNETLDVRNNGIGSGNIRLLTLRNNSYIKNYGSKGYDQGILFGNSYTPFSLPVTPTWAFGLNPTFVGGAVNDFTISRQKAGSWYTLLRIDTSAGSIKFNTNNWPSSTVGQSTNRIVFGGSTIPVLLAWNESTPAADNRSIFQIGAATGLGSNTISGMVLTGGIANQYTAAGFGKIQTYNHSGTITDAILIDSSQVVNTTSRLNINGATDNASYALNVTGAGLFSTTLTSQSTTASTSTTTGGIIGSGGLGIAGAAYIGGRVQSDYFITPVASFADGGQSWRLGKPNTTVAATLNATNYVSVEIGGITYKLALIN